MLDVYEVYMEALSGMGPHLDRFCLADAVTPVLSLEVRLPRHESEGVFRQNRIEIAEGALPEKRESSRKEIILNKCRKQIGSPFPTTASARNMSYTSCQLQ